MAVNSLVALAIVTLVFYLLAAPFAVFAGVRHGMKRSGPWYFMIILVLARVIGEPMIIATNGVFDYTDNISIAGNILSAIGLSPLLLSAGAILQNLNTLHGASNSVIPVKIVRLMGLVPLVALVLSIIGSTDSYSSDVSKHDTGMTLRVAATALYVVYWAMLVLATLLLHRARNNLNERSAQIFLAAVVISLPFLAVRVIYTCLITFGSQASQLANSNNILTKALMGSLMEFVVVIVYLAAGILAPKLPQAQPGSKIGSGSPLMQDTEMGKYNGQYTGRTG